MLAECAICSAGEIDTREPIESMTAIPYDADRDGLGRETKTIYACSFCSEQEGFDEAIGFKSLPYCSICKANGIETHEFPEDMTAIPYNADRDGLEREIEVIYACSVCSAQEGFKEHFLHTKGDVCD